VARPELFFTSVSATDMLLLILCQLRNIYIIVRFVMYEISVLYFRVLTTNVRCCHLFALTSINSFFLRNYICIFKGRSPTWILIKVICEILTKIELFPCYMRGITFRNTGSSCLCLLLEAICPAICRGF